MIFLHGSCNPALRARANITTLIDVTLPKVNLVGY